MRLRERMVSYIRDTLWPLLRASDGTANYSAVNQEDEDILNEQTKDGLADEGSQAQRATSFTLDPIMKDGTWVSSEEADIGIEETANNPFANPDVAVYWKRVYDEAHYECRHILNPKITWTEEEEKALVRKLDWKVCLWAVSIPLQPLNPFLDRE